MVKMINQCFIDRHFILLKGKASIQYLFKHRLIKIKFYQPRNLNVLIIKIRNKLMYLKLF